MNQDVVVVWTIVQERQREIAKLQKYHQYRFAIDSGKGAGQAHPGKTAGIVAAAQFLADSMRGMLRKQEPVNGSTNNPC